MRYRSITLNDNKGYQYSLIKYNEEYQTQLEEIKTMNKELADSVEKCPKIYSELSDHQSYMIFRGKKSCVGAINIETSTDEKDLEIKVQFIEEKFKNEENIVAVLEQLVDSLGLYCYERENIEIHLLNNIDLEKVNKYKYQKNSLFENVTTYTTSNGYNNRLFPALLNEIKETEQNLMNWKQCWLQLFGFCGLNDFQTIIDDQLMSEYGNSTIPLTEVFYKVESILWDNINSHRSTRRICFERNGQIHFDKKQKGSGKNSYEFLYEIFKYGFNLKKVAYVYDEKKEIFEIDENKSWTRIQSDNLKVVYLKEAKIKKVQYKSPIIGNSSISLELFINEQNEIERCYVDFRTHKKGNKINGIYALRILSTREFKLNFISRKGIRYDNFVEELASIDNQLYETVLNGELTVDLIDELIKKMIPIINRKAFSKNRPSIVENSKMMATNAFTMELEAINFIKQIRGEIPLPYLQENLDRFIEEYSLVENYTRKRVLDREKWED